MERQKIVWDSDKVNRLWDYKASCSINESSYFGYQVGEAIIHFCSFFVNDIHKCNVLDYGSGMGHLINFFLNEKINITGVDMSKEEVTRVNGKFSGNNYFHGVKLFDGKKLPFEDNEFDLITCTEVIEHVLDEHVDGLLCELKRILKPGGVILFTTPNNENVIEAEVCCPNCNTVFHMHGHVRTYTRDSMVNLMEAHGYKTVISDGTDYNYIQRYLHCPSLMDLSIRQMIRRFERFMVNMSDLFHKRDTNSKLFKVYIDLKRKPHLFYVGTKTAD